MTYLQYMKVVELYVAGYSYQGIASEIGVNVSDVSLFIHSDYLIKYLHYLAERNRTSKGL